MNLSCHLRRASFGFGIVRAITTAFIPMALQSTIALGDDLFPVRQRGIFAAIESAADVSGSVQHAALLRNGKLTALVADNEAFGGTHQAGYNGVAELALSPTQANLFVPRYAGLNLEHIFNGDTQSFGWNIF